MPELAFSHICYVSDQHPAVGIQMVLTVDFPGGQSHAVGMHMEPSLIPPNLLDVLWTKGICAGVHDAVREAKDILAASEVEVDVRQLRVSEPYQALSKEELERLGNDLRVATFEKLRSILLAKLDSRSD